MAGEHLFDPDGQAVDLVTDKCKFIARGFYNSKSRIRVRLYTWSQEEALDEAFFRRRIEAAIELRRQIGYEPVANDDPSVGNALRGIPNPADAITSVEALPQSRNATEGCCLPRSAGEQRHPPRLQRSRWPLRPVVDRYGDYLVVQVTSWPSPSGWR